MVEKIFAQLENLAKALQVNRLRRFYSDLTGIKIGDGFLWQHPGRLREVILRRFQERVEGLDRIV